jgi:hypothetical protein
MNLICHIYNLINDINYDLDKFYDLFIINK